MPLPKVNTPMPWRIFSEVLNSSAFTAQPPVAKHKLKPLYLRSTPTTYAQAVQTAKKADKHTAIEYK